MKEMNRKVIILAVAAALSAPTIALADDSKVQIYGKFNIDFQSVKASGGNASKIPSRNRVSSNSSNIGFKGVEPLGGGLDAWFQVESATNLDAGGGTWASRNSAVGLKSAFGTLLLGQWDSPHKTSTGRLDPFGNTSIAAYTGIIDGGSTHTTANDANRNSFNRRMRNTIQYWSPKLNGFSARVAYGANEEKTDTVNPLAYSLSLVFENGPFYVGGAFEQHENYEAAGNEDTSAKLFGSFKFGSTTIGLILQRLDYEGTPTISFKGTAANKLEVTNYFLSLIHKVGNHNLYLAYGMNGKVEVDGVNDADRKAKQLSLGYGYSLSKRTEVYAMATKIDNKDASSSQFGNNAFTVSAGQDPQGFGVGIKHTF